MPDINMQVFEEAQRNQLVTEIDIQTQVALNDYQVQLSDIANPTQSQDNVVIDRYGELLSHWNESLDFDTWVKMSMEVAGKRILMLHGDSNVVSASSIISTMIAGDVFNTDQLGTYWLGDTGDFTVSDGKIASSSVSGWDSIYNQINHGTNDYVAHVNLYTGVSTDAWLGIQIGDNISGISGNFSALQQANWSGTNALRHRSSFAVNDDYVSTTETTYDVELTKIGTTYKMYVDGSETDSDTATEFDATYFNIIGIDVGNAYINYIYFRKSTATEPMCIADDIPQNIAVALKLLGRAG